MSFKESSHACIGLIDRWLDYQTYIKEIPSVTVGIDAEGETIFKKSYGYKDLEDREKATPEMLYRIASHSKLLPDDTFLGGEPGRVPGQQIIPLG